MNTACISVAKLQGARVIVVGSSAEKLERAKALGADVTIDRSQVEDWSTAAHLATDKRGADVVVDNVGSTFMPSLRCCERAAAFSPWAAAPGPRSRSTIATSSIATSPSSVRP